MSDPIPREVYQAGFAIRAHLDNIRDLFKPPVKISLLVRAVDYPDGTRDMLVTEEDDLVEIIAAIQTRMTKPSRTGLV